MALKILLAEDEEALSRVYKATLEHQGYEVDQAFNGQEAVDLAAQNAYQVMIMDIMMPIKTGIEALKEIRSSGNTTMVVSEKLKKLRPIKGVKFHRIVFVFSV